MHVETTSGPDMCASFSRFYSFTGLIVHPSLHHPTYPPFQRYPAAEASWKLHKQVLYEEKGGKLTRMWIKFDPWIFSRKTEEDGPFVKLIKSLVLIDLKMKIKIIV